MSAGIASLSQHMDTVLSAVLDGARLAESLANSAALQHKESLRDIVTQADLRISELLVQRLAATGLPVISEEQPEGSGSPSGPAWLVDPIDGTVNFSHGLPSFAVSVGLLAERTFHLGAVCAPRVDELYFTLNPERAMLNGRPFTHTHRRTDEALIAASFSAAAGASQYELFRQIDGSSRGCLRTGSAALNICWAATGRLQAAYGLNARLWDVAGGIALARAAGCEVQLRFHPAGRLDYAVGSREVVAHIRRLAAGLHLWEETTP